MSEDDDLGKTEADFDDLYARGTEVDVIATAAADVVEEEARRDAATIWEQARALRTRTAELEQARRVAVTLEQQVALLTAYAQLIADRHYPTRLGCGRCEEPYPCEDRLEADRVLLAVSTVEPC